MACAANPVRYTRSIAFLDWCFMIIACAVLFATNTNFKFVLTSIFYSFIDSHCEMYFIA